MNNCDDRIFEQQALKRFLKKLDDMPDVDLTKYKPKNNHAFDGGVRKIQTSRCPTTGFRGPSLRRIGQRMKEAVIIKDTLNRLRGMRDKYPFGSEIRSAYNQVCDRLDVLESKLLRREVRKG